jgi:ESS family glutamate:Na+ symporter
MPDEFYFAIFLAAGALLVGFVLRATLRPLMWLYVPASVVGGLLALGLMQLVLRTGPGEFEYVKKDIVFGDDAGGLQLALAGAFNALRNWPGFLIAVVFAGLLLERPGRPLGQAARGAARQGVVAWLIILGQVTIGLLAVLLILRPTGLLPSEVPASFGQLIEVGFAGGHGTAASMGEVFDRTLDFPVGQDLGLLFATYGLLYGTISGVILVNLGVRRGWTRGGRRDLVVPKVSGLEARTNPEPAAMARVGRTVIDPLVFQVLLMALALGIGYLFKQSFEAAAAAVLPPDDPDVKGDFVEFMGNVPLFLFALLGGWIVRRGMTLLGVADLIDAASVQRIMGVAIEFLIVAALATLQVEAVAAYFWPSAILLILGSAWAVFCLLVIGRWLLPREHWFELGLINYGMSTATTAQGMLLLRIVDPDLETGAAEEYAAAAPLTALFIGGGLLTVAGFPLTIAAIGLPAVVALCLVAMAVLAALGWALRRNTPAERLQ